MKITSASSYKHSLEFLEKRKALFPSDEDLDGNDLGHISLLNYDSNSNDDSINELIFDNHKSSINDYDIIGVVDGIEKTLCKSPVKDVTKTILETFLSTPLQESPTKSHQTPNDSSLNNNCTSNIPKLIRKSTLNSSFNDNLLNPNIAMLTSLHYSQSMNNCGNKNSKVRTALFPELPVPTKSFYPKPEHSNSNIIEKNNSLKTEKRPAIRKHRQLYLCKRKHLTKSQFGQINAGVKHKIKKKIVDRKLNNLKIIEAALNKMENSPLNEYFEELEKLNELKQSQTTKLIENFGIVEDTKELKERTRKRLHSPIQESSRKFFKSSRQNVLVKENCNSVIKSANNQDEFDYSFISTTDDELSLSNKQMDNILNSLKDEQKKELLISGTQKNSSKLQVINKTDNQANVNILLSPTSQMCDMTSGLALNSPKRAQNLSTMLEKMPKKSAEQKLFPLFYSNNNSNNKGGQEKRKDSVGNNIIIKKFKQLSKNQMLLDAGQKKFGVTQCNECKFVYHLGDPSDEIIHLNYHNAGPVLRFHGWKNERIVYDNFGNGRIIQIIPNDPKAWWKKVKDILEVVNRDLGYFDIQLVYDYCQIFLYIKNKSIVGVLIAEEKSVGHKLLTTSTDQIDLCSEESFRIKCGVSRIWVSHTNRNQGIATCLMNCLKKHFIFGYIMNNEDIAFSSPTEAGKMFGKSYFRTSNFLIYS